MRFTINSQTYIRLHKICHFFDSCVAHDIRQELSVLRLEIQAGKTLAIATNQQIAAVELLSTQSEDQFDGAVHLTYSDQLLEKCKDFNGDIIIDAIPDLAMSVTTTEDGWAYTGEACVWSEGSLLSNWRQWFPDMLPTESKGIMQWDAYHVQTLFESSPTGQIVFPEFIDANQPCVLRDRNDSRWVGVFIPKPFGEKQTIPATFPEWWTI
jgi:hypothetical protein